MSSEARVDVRVHVRLGSMRLDYEGTQEFYESKVEALVAAAAMKGASGLSRPPSLGAGPAATKDAARPAAPTESGANGRAEDAGSAAPAEFVPKTSEFGRYIRRLGPEAGEPDRQVVALAFYLWNYERKERFGRREVEGCFRALGLPAPGNLDEIFADLTDRKRFLEDAGDGTLRLSKKGENYVKTRLLSA